MFRSLLTGGLLLMATAGCAQDAGSPVTVGKRAPDFTVTGIDGESFRLSDRIKAGKNVALMFDRAHW